MSPTHHLSSRQGLLRSSGAMNLQCYAWILWLFQQIFGDHGGDVLHSDKYIPDDIILNILCRLPAKSLLKCQKVCKKWSMLISSYKFIEMHQRMAVPAMIQHFPLQHRNFCIIDGKSVKECWVKRLRGSRCFDFVSCCNGLVLLEEKFENHKYFILNPLLPGRITTLNIISSGKLCGFYFHPLAKEYRILFVEKGETLYNYSMYLIGGKTWRRTACPSFIGEPHCAAHSPAILHGALHWCGRIKGRESQFLVFDIVSEGFSFRPFPKYFCEHSAVKLLVKEDWLCLCSTKSKVLAVDIWILEDYANWRWVKKYKVNLDWDVQKYPMEDFREPEMFFVKVVSIHKDELRLLWNYRGLFCCKIGSNIVKKLAVKRTIDEILIGYMEISYFASYTKSLATLPDD